MHFLPVIIIQIITISLPLNSYAAEHTEPQDKTIILSAAKDTASPNMRSRQKEITAEEEQMILVFLNNWLKSWENKDLDNYMESYSKEFKSRGMDWEAWKRYKASLNKINSQRKISINDIKVIKGSNDTFTASFIQTYIGEGKSDIGVKKLYLADADKGVKIVREEWTAIQTQASAKRAEIPSEKPPEETAKEIDKNAPSAKVEQDIRPLLGAAWKHFEHKDYKMAADIFAKLLSFPEIEEEARYGLALSYYRLKNTREALPLLEELVARKIKLKDTLNMLITLLVEKKEYKKASSYLTMLDRKEKGKWERAIKDSSLDAALKDAKRTGDAAKLIAFINDNQDALNECFSPFLFLEAADILLKNGSPYAVDIYKKILISCPNKYDVRLHIFYSLKTALTPYEAIEEVKKEEARKDITADYKGKLDKIKLLLLREKLISIKPESSEMEDAAMEILSFAPEDKTALAALAWRYFNTARYKDAYEAFSKLLRTYPDEIDYANGMAMTMIKLGKTDEAINLAEKYKGNENAADMVKNIYLAVLGDKLAALKSDSPEAEGIIRQILLLAPEDKGALSLLAWRYFNTERYDKAYEMFSKLLKTYPDDADYAYGMINTLIKLGKDNDALEMASRYRTNEKVASLEKDLRLRILWDKVSNTASDAPELEDLAREMLSINPAEQGIRDILAWWYYNQEDYEKAYNEFYTLYSRSPDTKGYAFGLVSSLLKLERLDEALEIAVKNKGVDERLASIETEIYLTKANAAYKDKNYRESEIYFGKALSNDPEDENTKKFLRLSRYRQTKFAKVLSSIEGLPGYTWGSITHDINGSTGTGISFLVNQGIDWFKLPRDIVVNTFVEYRYAKRTLEKTYSDESGYAIGLQFKKAPFRLGLEYLWNEYEKQNKPDSTKDVYLSWYHEWYKYMKRWGSESWLNIQALAGHTYGKISHDLDNDTGTGIYAFINQGIDWFTLPSWDITFNTYAEYRLAFRTKDKLWYNSHTPVIGAEFQRPPFKLGAEYLWENYTERNRIDQRWNIYMRWYYGWDLKPKELRE